jgi:crotonobetainyl-CoA:carnitine CoA-transferase CaiB-like acyl-CoA transferase
LVERGLEALDGSGLRRPQLLGEHNVEVLGELGYAAEEVAALRAQNVI